MPVPRTGRGSRGRFGWARADLSPRETPSGTFDPAWSVPPPVAPVGRLASCVLAGVGAGGAPAPGFGIRAPAMV